MRFAPLGLLFLLAAATSDHPKYVVPDVPDLTIRMRTIFGPSGAAVETATYFFKGPRSRQERSFSSAPPAPRSTFTWISRCDERRTLLLNPDARRADWTERLRVQLTWTSAHPAARNPLIARQREQQTRRL